MFQPLPSQPAPLPGIYLITVLGAKGGYLTAGDTLSQAIPLHQTKHMAMRPRVLDTSKPRHALAGRGARDFQATNHNPLGPNRALLHLTMKHTAQLPATLEGKKHFILEVLTDDVITLAANTLMAARNKWDDTVGHPTERKDRLEQRDDILPTELMDQLIHLTSPPEQCVQTIVPEVTDWTVLELPLDTSTVTVTCHQHTWWVAQWDGRGTAARRQTCTSEPETASLLALRDRFRHCTHQANHPLAHWLALKTAVHWTVDAPTSVSTLSTTWLNLSLRTQTSDDTDTTLDVMPRDTEQTLELRTAGLQTHANEMRGMLQPREGQIPAYSIFKGHKPPKPAPHPAPEPVRLNPRPRPEGAGAPARRVKRPKPAPKVAPPPPEPKGKTPDLTTLLTGRMQRHAP